VCGRRRTTSQRSGTFTETLQPTDACGMNRRQVRLVVSVLLALLSLSPILNASLITGTTHVWYLDDNTYEFRDPDGTLASYASSNLTEHVDVFYDAELTVLKLSETLDNEDSTLKTTSTFIDDSTFPQPASSEPRGSPTSEFYQNHLFEILTSPPSSITAGYVNLMSKAAKLLGRVKAINNRGDEETKEEDLKEVAEELQEVNAIHAVLLSLSKEESDTIILIKDLDADKIKFDDEAEQSSV